MYDNVDIFFIISLFITLASPTFAQELNYNVLCKTGSSLVLFRSAIHLVFDTV